MLVLLPPSETKVDGGAPGTSLNLSQLSFPSQNSLREALLHQVLELCADEARALKALKLGPKGAPEVERNRELLSSPVMPALGRYTGVLFDHLDVDTLDAKATTWLEKKVAVFSALFGLIRATDPIPAYRLSFNSRVSGGPLTTQWSRVAGAVWDEVDGFVLDLRSEGYRKLSLLSEGKGVFVSLVTPGSPGSRKALGHANKSVKGRLVRALAETGAALESVDDLVSWGSAHGYFFDPESLRDGVVDLVISES